MEINSKAKYHVPTIEQLISWFIDNVLTIHDAKSCLQFFAFFTSLYFIGERIIGISKHLWTWIMLCAVVFLFLVPAENAAMIESFVELVKSIPKISPKSCKFK